MESHLAMTTDHELEQHHTIGRLCVSGDRACANGDFAMLRAITMQLAERLEEPLHCELVTLATMACDDLGLSAAWSLIKDRIYRDVPSSAQTLPGRREFCASLVERPRQSTTR